MASVADLVGHTFPALHRLQPTGSSRADAYTALAETSDNGYPVLEHVKKLVKDEIIWTPAIADLLD